MNNHGERSGTRRERKEPQQQCQDIPTNDSAKPEEAQPNNIDNPTTLTRMSSGAQPGVVRETVEDEEEKKKQR